MNNAQKFSLPASPYSGAAQRDDKRGMNKCIVTLYLRRRADGITNPSYIVKCHYR